MCSIPNKSEVCDELTEQTANPASLVAGE